MDGKEVDLYVKERKIVEVPINEIEKFKNIPDAAEGPTRKPSADIFNKILDSAEGPSTKINLDDIQW